LPAHEEAILDHIVSSGHKLITIAGATCSGKTTFADWLSYRIDAAMIAMDDFYRDIDDQFLPYVDSNPSFDLPDSYKIIELEDSIRMLLAGHNILVPIYDIPTNTRTDRARRIFACRNSYIVEGLYAFLVDVSSYKIYITADYVKLRERRLARDIPALAGLGISAEAIGRHFDRIMQVSSEHLTSQKRQADLIIDTTYRKGG